MRNGEKFSDATDIAEYEDDIPDLVDANTYNKSQSVKIIKNAIFAKLNGDGSLAKEFESDAWIVNKYGHTFIVKGEEKNLEAKEVLRQWLTALGTIGVIALIISIDMRFSTACVLVFVVYALESISKKRQIELRF